MILGGYRGIPSIARFFTNRMPFVNGFRTIIISGTSPEATGCDIFSSNPPE